MVRKLLNVLRRVKHRFRKPDHRGIFTEIYKKKIWGSDGQADFYSGSGSDEIHSAPYTNMVIDFIQAHSIKSVVDLGCGDFRVGKNIVNATQVNYTGVDVVKDLVDHNNARYKTHQVKFLYKNITSDRLPDGELCLIRQVLQHLSNKDIIQVLKRTKKYKYLIITEHLPASEKPIPNLDKSPDGSIRYYNNSGVYLDLPPFNKQVKELLSVEPDDHPNSRIVTFQVLK